MNKASKKTKVKKLTPLQAIHETASGFYESNLMDLETMRTFDALCLPPVKEFRPREIKHLRLIEKVSQTVFAKYLNTSPSTVKQWETGEKHPRGISLKILNLVADKGLQILL